MKRLIAMILVLVTVFSLAACAPKDDTKEPVKPNNDASAPADVVDPTDKEEGPSVDDETEETELVETEPVTKTLDYKMAKIGSDSRLSESKYGFATGLTQDGREGQTIYALSWVFEEAEYDAESTNYYTFFLKDAKTGEVIEEDEEHIVLKQYRSTIYDTDEFEGNGIPFYGHPRKEVCTLVLYSDYEVKFEDIEIWATLRDVEYLLDFNAELEEITSAPKRARGYMFIKLKDSYYVADGASSGGGRGDDHNYDVFDFISIKDPLSSIGSAEPIMDATKITFYDTETGEHLPCVPGTELYYEEEVESDSIDVNIGVSTTDEEIQDNWDKRYRVFYDGITLLC